MKRALTSCKPTKMWIDGKCFEIKKFQKKARREKKNDDVSCDSNELGVKYDIGKNEDGKLFTSFRLPPQYYTKLLKYPYLRLKTLEDSTNTNISIPQCGNLIITGNNEEQICEARDEIHSVIGEIRNQYTAMQFVSIPTKSEEIVTNFVKFREDILNGEEIDGMEESIFQKPSKLHLTIAVFSLLDESEKLEATKALQDYKTMTLDPLIKKSGPLKIRVSGLGTMNDDLKKVNVLFANARIVDENEELNLQKLVDGISDHFYDWGLMKSYQDSVKLHMTLINTKYRKSKGSPKKRWLKRQSFDATTVIERFKDFDFGECCLNSVHISLISSTGSDGFYQPLSIISVEEM